MAKSKVQKPEVEKVMQEVFWTLMFYADAKNYIIQGDTDDTIINYDKGSRARQILSDADETFAKLDNQHVK